jgi:hypothetical protein
MTAERKAAGAARAPEFGEDPAATGRRAAEPASADTTDQTGLVRLSVPILSNDG